MAQHILFLEDYVHPGSLAMDGLRGGGLTGGPEQGAMDQEEAPPHSLASASGPGLPSAPADDAATYVMVGAPAQMRAEEQA
eukprot:12900619-Prorocentrum_lima.AAC.1